MGPKGRLEVGIDEMAAVEWASKGGRGQVFSRGEKLVGKKPFLGGGGASSAVGNYACWVALAAEAGFQEAAAVVQHHHVRHYWCLLSFD